MSRRVTSCLVLLTTFVVGLILFYLGQQTTNIELDWSYFWINPERVYTLTLFGHTFSLRGPVLEAIAVVDGLIGVALLTFARNKKLAWWNWVFGIVSTVIYLFVFWDAMLYASALIQPYYVVTSVIGAILWWGKWNATDEGALVVYRMPVKRWLMTTAIIGASTVPIWYLFKHYTGNPSPLWDTLIATISIVAQWVMIRKYVEHWVGWLVVDAIAVPFYASQHFGLTALLYLAFGVLSARGLLQWIWAYRDNNALLVPISPLDRVSASTGADDTVFPDKAPGGFTPRKGVTKIEPALWKSDYIAISDLTSRRVSLTEDQLPIVDETGKTTYNPDLEELADFLGIPVKYNRAMYLAKHAKRFVCANDSYGDVLYKLQYINEHIVHPKMTEQQVYDIALDAFDGRVAVISTLGTSTGRFSTNRPNVSGIPRSNAG